jgi:hypothetical protein
MAEQHGSEPDEFMPHERGLLMGHRWAEEARKRGLSARDAGDNTIDPVVAAAAEPPRIAEQMRRWLMDDCGVRERLDASEDPDAESAFWGGFQSGVRAYLVEVETGTDN